LIIAPSVASSDSIETRKRGMQRITASSSLTLRVSMPELRSRPTLRQRLFRRSSPSRVLVAGDRPGHSFRFRWPFVVLTLPNPPISRNVTHRRSNFVRELKSLRNSNPWRATATLEHITKPLVPQYWEACRGTFLGRDASLSHMRVGMHALPVRHRFGWCEGTG